MATDSARHELSKADADAWLDGFMPYALLQDDIAGAEVVIVKDGQVLTERGFGYADMATRTAVDPTLTIFRAGSVSKLFTWTAVMQLVEQGKIDLDADVNRYIDFKIPPFRGRPITMRDLMTHTPGFGEVFKGGIRSTGAVPPLGVVVKRMLPDRIYPAGTTPAYSNYGCALAGYVVERISGMPFNTYVEHNIFQPLGMVHSTFRQPPPPDLAPLLSKSYAIASKGATPFELVSIPPAGGVSVSGDDMAKFMMALLNQGANLMRPRTAQQMLEPTRVVLPELSRMALGFYEQQVNGLSAIGHGGDLNHARAYLWLLPAQNIGVYIVMNSSGASEAASFDIRLGLFQAFCDRYFPAPSDGIDRALHRLIHGLSWLALATLAGWMLLFQSFGTTDASLDGWIWLLEIASAIGFAGLAACALWMAARAWTRPVTWSARAWSTLRAAGALSILWVAVAFHLISFGVNY